MRNSKCGIRNERRRGRPAFQLSHSAFRIPNSASRPGFTLLEVLLAISISVLVLFLVGTALYLQLRIIDGARSEVEQAQVARALLRHIGDDLRNVIKYDPQQGSIPASSASGTAAAGAQALGSA